MGINPYGLLCIYQQSTGRMTCTNNTTHEVYAQCDGYAGRGNGRNNPDAQNIPNVGSVPRGEYTVGESFRHPHAGAGTRRLTPANGNEMNGRAGFLIHGDNACHDASEGCPVLPPACGAAIPAGETLRVER